MNKVLSCSYLSIVFIFPSIDFEKWDIILAVDFISWRVTQCAFLEVSLQAKPLNKVCIEKSFIYTIFVFLSFSSTTKRHVFYLLLTNLRQNSQMNMHSSATSSWGYGEKYQGFIRCFPSSINSMFFIRVTTSWSWPGAAKEPVCLDDMNKKMIQLQQLTTSDASNFV